MRWKGPSGGTVDIVCSSLARVQFTLLVSDLWINTHPLESTRCHGEIAQIRGARERSRAARRHPGSGRVGDDLFRDE